MPEHGVQGEVPLADRKSGRSQLGYSCNLVRIGQFQGVGAGWQNDWYGHCDYYDTAENTTAPGVQVLDVSDPAHPKPTDNLITPAMLGPWESLKVNQKRGLLGGVAANGAGQGPLFFDVYDVKTDCAHPTLLSSTPTNLPAGHEGAWAPDGLTYYGSETNAGTIAAIDVSNPALPKLITVLHQPTHGLSVSNDGNTLYLANNNGNGLDIVDVSQIQSRSAVPGTSVIGHIYWTDGSTAQSTLPISYAGHPYLIFFDEGGGSCCGTGVGLGAFQGVPAGAARIVDLADPAHPKIVSVLRLAIQAPKNAAANQAEVAGNGLFGYQAHYCTVDRENSPTAAACGYIQSGIRVFDIRNPLKPREIAYFNPPAQVTKHGRLLGSEHDCGPAIGGGPCPGAVQPANLTADWCTSQIRFVHARDGSWQLWAQCQDNGFMTLKLTNGVYPLADSPAAKVAGAAPVARHKAAQGPAGNAGPGAESLAATGTPAGLPVFAVVLVALAAVLPRLRRRGLRRKRVLSGS